MSKEITKHNSYPRYIEVLEENRELRKYQKDLEKTIWVRNEKIKKFEEYMDALVGIAQAGRFPNTGVAHKMGELRKELMNNE